MISNFVQWIARGFLQPRESMRLLLAQGPGISDAVLMVALGYLISAISEVLIIGGGGTDGSSPFGHHVQGIVLQALVFIVFAGITLLVTNSAGGVANFAETCVVIGWFSLVTSFLTPIFHAAFVSFQKSVQAASAADTVPEVNSTALMAVFAASGASLWLLASYIAEANGFRSVARVFWVVILLSFVAGLIMALAISGAA